MENAATVLAAAYIYIYSVRYIYIYMYRRYLLLHIYIYMVLLSTLCAELVGVHSQYCKARVPCGRLSTLAP